MVKNLREIAFTILWIMLGVGSIVFLYMYSFGLMFSLSDGHGNYHPLPVLLSRLSPLSYVLLIVPVKSVLLSRLLGAKIGNWSIATIAGTFFAIMVIIAYGYLLQWLYSYRHFGDNATFVSIVCSMYFVFRLCIINVQAKNNRSWLGKRWVNLNFYSVWLVIVCFIAYHLSWHFSGWFLVFALAVSEFVNAYSYIRLAREQDWPKKKNEVLSLKT